MTRKYRKQKVFQTKPITYRRLYSKKPNEDVIPIIIGFILLAAGINIFSSTHDLRVSPFIFLGILLILGTLFGTLRSIIIDDDKLIFSYRLTKNIYRAGDVKAISWQTGLYLQAGGRTIVIGHRQSFPGDLGPSGDLYGQYGRYTFLSIEMKNGKKVQIPGSPYSRLDIRKHLLEWQEKYQSPTSKSAAVTE
jgi:hypothetical protein